MEWCAAVGEKAAVVLGFRGSVVVPVLDEGGAVELNAGAAAGAVGLVFVPCSVGDCGGSEEEISVVMFVGS